MKKTEKIILFILFFSVLILQCMIIMELKETKDLITSYNSSLWDVIMRLNNLTLTTIYEEGLPYEQL